MATAAEAVKPRSAERRRWITPALTLALIVLRIPLVTGVRMFTGESPDWVLVLYQVGTYLLITALMVWESARLEDYFINPLAIWIIILFKPIQTLYPTLFWPGLTTPLAFPKWPTLLIWADALFLLWWFRARLFNRKAFAWTESKWIFIGLLAGLATVIVTAYPAALEETRFGPDSNIPVVSILLSGLATIPYQLGYAAISEEPVFRGFLWGYLRKSGWRDVWIWLFQAGLFMLGHLYYIKSNPMSFWVIVPLGGIILGWLAWRSKSIATSMTAHAVVNGLSRGFGIIVVIMK